MNNEEMALTTAADTTMPTELHKVYVRMSFELAAFVERERIEMVEDTYEHLRRIHAKLAPLGLFKVWCQAAGINYSTAANRVLDKQADDSPRRTHRLLEQTPERQEPAAEPPSYAVVEQYAPEPPALERQEPQTASASYQLPEPTPLAVGRMSRAYEQLTAITADDITAWLRVAPRHRQDELLRRIDLIRSVILDARIDATA